MLVISCCSMVSAAEPIKKAKPYKQTKAELKTQREIVSKFIIGYYHGISRVCDIINYNTIDDKVETLDRNMVMYDNNIYVDTRVPVDKAINPKKTSVLATMKSGNALVEIEDVGKVEDSASLRKLFEDEIKKTEEDIKSFFIVKMDGTFTDLHLSEVTGEEKLNKIFNGEKIDKNKEYKYDKLKGTLVAVRVTDYLKSKDSLGWNLHFLSEDKTKGGSVLELKVENASLLLKRIRSLNIYM